MPTASNGASVSISHARRFAVAVASDAPDTSVGVDIEPLDQDGPLTLLAERILSEQERGAHFEGEPVPILRRLSLKEAAYKALFPRYGHVALQEIAVLRLPATAPVARGTPPLPLGEDTEPCAPQARLGGVGEGRSLKARESIRHIAERSRPSPSSTTLCSAEQVSLSSPNGRGGVPLEAFSIVATEARIPVEGASFDLNGHILSLARLG
jgi:phosphopantetheinyl transferase (holo-ACP synthase)